jgi:ClpP class serine protease
MRNFPLLAQRVFNTPVAISPMKLDAIVEYLDLRMSGNLPERIGVGALEGAQMRALADDASFYSQDTRRPFRSSGHIAVIPVRGTLVQKASFMDAESGLVGYNDILRQARAAMDADDIHGIFMPYGTGGGECAGMWAAAEELASFSKAEGGKPIYAYLDDHACSAGYVLASSADRIFGRREVYGGSIAALISMVDKSKAYEQVGLQQHVVRADWADRKARGTGGEAFDSELIASMQHLVNESSDLIVEFVSAMRSIPEDQIKALRGDIFTATEMMEIGLMDEIASEQEAWAQLESDTRSTRK